MTPAPRRLVVFRTRDEALDRFPRRTRRPGDVVASAGSLSRWPHQLLGERFNEVHLFYPADANAIRLIRTSVLTTGGPIHLPGLQSALPVLEVV